MSGSFFEVWENVKNRLREQDFNAVQTALDGLAEELGVQIIIQREDLFQFMYKI